MEDQSTFTLVCSPPLNILNLPSFALPCFAIFPQMCKIKKQLTENIELGSVSTFALFVFFMFVFKAIGVKVLVELNSNNLTQQMKMFSC